MEIYTPLAYPGKFDLHDVYSISYPDGKLVNGGSSALTNQKLCSSVSTINNTSILVTTSPVDCFMAVSIIRDDEEPTIFYLKLTDYKDIIAAKAFCKDTNTKEIFLLLVDSSASLIRIRIPTKTFLPKESLAIQLTDLIDTAVLSQLFSMELTPAMVDFGSADLLILALNPYLFSVDLHTHRAYQWMLKPVKPRAYFPFSLGTVEQTPMKPIAAVSVVDKTTVYTLDSAGHVHRWGLSGSHPEYSEHLSTNNHIPDPGYWSHPILMCGRTYSGVRVLAIFIANSMPVDDTSPGFDQSRREASKNIVCVIDESADGDVHAIRLQVPDGDVVSMEFDASSQRCRLKVQLTDRLVIYPPSNLAMVSREPIIVRQDAEPSRNDNDSQDDFEGIRQLYWTPGRKRTGMSVFQALEQAEREGWKKVLRREQPHVWIAKNDIVVHRGCIVRERTTPPFLEHALQASSFVESSESLLRLELMFRDEVDNGTIVLSPDNFKAVFNGYGADILPQLPEITFSTALQDIPGPPQTAGNTQQLGSQTQAAAWDLCVQYLHLLSRLFLVRWLQAVRLQDQYNTALLEYLRILSALQVCLRHVDERHRNTLNLKHSKIEPITVLDLLLHRLSAPNSTTLATAALNVILVPPGPTHAGSFPEIALLGENVDPYYVLRLVAPLLLTDARPDVKRLVAQCLLRISSHHDETKEKILLRRAFQVLEFDSYNAQRSLEDLQSLEKSVDSPAGYSELFLHITSALAATSADDPNFVNLWNMKFSTACKKEDWLTAAKTAEAHPTQKEGYTKRLVRIMVDAGALGKVISRCEEEMGTTAFYDITVEALAESYELQSDWYSCPTNDRDDHLLALFCIHCKMYEWRSAAQVMALRYSRARDYLLNDNIVGRNHVQAFNDLVESAQLTMKSLLQVEEDAQFLLEGRTDKRLFIKKGKFLTVRMLRGRAIQSVAIRRIFEKEGAVDKDVATIALSDDASERSIEAVFEKMCESGLYKDAITFASSAKELMEESHEPFLALMLSFLSGHIIPLTGSVREIPNANVSDFEAAFSLFSVEAALSLFSITDYFETRSKRVSQLDQNQLRTAALALLQSIVETFNSRDVPLAASVAIEMLAGGFTYLPSWLENLFMFGNVPSDRPGLFAPRRKRGETEGYMGDPVFLVDLYTKWGRLRRACFVIETVLAGVNGDYRMQAASSRLPEKGEIDIVPYHKIQYLKDVINRRIGSPECDVVYANILRTHFNRMESSLSQHKKFLQLSEQGLSSARTLNHATPMQI